MLLTLSPGGGGGGGMGTQMGSKILQIISGARCYLINFKQKNMATDFAS